MEKSGLALHSASPFFVHARTGETWGRLPGSVTPYLQQKRFNFSLNSVGADRAWDISARIMLR
jgi:hypothetical protein